MKHFVGLAKRWVGDWSLRLVSQNLLQIIVEVQNVISVFAKSQRPAGFNGIKDSLEEVFDEFLSVFVKNATTNVLPLEGGTDQLNETLNISNYF